MLSLVLSILLVSITPAIATGQPYRLTQEEIAVLRAESGPKRRPLETRIQLASA